MFKTLPPVDHKDGEMYGDPIRDEFLIPSEYIEPYAQRYMMLCLEELAYFNTPVSEVKANLNGARRFLCFVSGLHAELAIENEYRKFLDTPDEELRTIAKQVFDVSK